MSMGEAQQAEALRSQELLGKAGLGANSSLVWALQGRIFSKTQCAQGGLWASEITDAWCSEHRAMMPGKVHTPDSLLFSLLGPHVLQSFSRLSVLFTFTNTATENPSGLQPSLNMAVS